MADIVKYHNDMNDISFKGLNEKELNIFFSLCFKTKEIGEDEITLSFAELKELSDGDVNLPRFLNALKSTYTKIITIPCFYRNERGFGAFVLFNKYFVDEKSKTVKIRVSKEFKYLLNDFFGNYTKFDLLEFVGLKSIYSKNLFKILKQFEYKKEKLFKIEEFRTLLAVPEKYTIANFNDRVISPIMNELPLLFNNFKLEKIKKGKRITSLKFTWNSKSDIVELNEKPNQITISQNLYNLIKEIQNLTFFQNVMTPRNIENLTKKYDEKTLIQILKRAQDHTYQEIKSIKYFDSVYESIKADPIIIIKPSEKIVEKEVQNYSPVEKIEKIDITREEFNKKYKEYLKKGKSPDDPFVKRAFEIKYNIVEVEEKSPQEIKVFAEKDIPENNLLGKNGKKLTGAALQMRINKILKHLKRS